MEKNQENLDWYNWLHWLRTKERNPKIPVERYIMSVDYNSQSCCIVNSVYYFCCGKEKGPRAIKASLKRRKKKRSYAILLQDLLYYCFDQDSAVLS